ncbi:MAG: FAD-dependent oxidoreductase, partial [Candidatus Omnitrophica bacterium]|nr:FAD-dependent oxidoreductase [Candidatus Omnitrophota bacterium]
EFNLVKSQVIREPHATLSSAPEIEKLRPAAKTSLKNFVLAGDWVQTGLPATIESAVLSGYQAAELVQERE